MFRRFLICLCVLVSAASCSNGGDNSQSNPALSFVDQPGSFAVGRITDSAVHDPMRDRNLKVTYWYPISGANTGALQAAEGAPLIAGSQQFPLLVLVHGLGDNAPGTWNYLGPHLASHGYLVMAPTMGSTLENIADVANHPGDISFLIDAALGVAGAQNPFTGRVATDKILVGGTSFGGLATYLLAYDPVHQDPRVRAVIMMAGIPSDLTPVNPALQMMAIYGTDDTAVTYDIGLNYYEAANSPKYLVTLQGAGHNGFSGSFDVNPGASMDHLRQKSLVRTAVFAFASSMFADSASDREAAKRFLQTDFSAENLDVQVMSEL